MVLPEILPQRAFPILTTRLAGEGDLDALTDLMIAFRQEHLRDQPLNIPQIRQTIQWGLGMSPDVFITVAGEGDARPPIVGWIMIALVTSPWTGERVAGEMVWYVRPEARHGVGLGLLYDAEREAKQRGAVRMQMIHLSTAPDPRGIYARLGYTPTDVTYERIL